ncbi:DUF72 domain-containing protein [Pannus brasiliensis CCIBt3594]|uniref:DUF72 domain-containing protein n=1 Tax=Pannus brasiliensis CCIBt3594 TaxID=1427578 RepID=A0AAW9QF93_9CHRO
MTFYLGCAVWSYKGWVGEFYPPKTQSKDFLSLYSQRFNTVEGNTTFYAVPDAGTVARWKQETPSGFKFVPKLPRTITHSGLLTPHLSDAIAFISRMQGLGDRLGPIFAQLPPSYSPEYLADLVNFLTAIADYDVAIAVEVRHRDWFEDPHRERLNDSLEKLSIGRVLLDTRPIYNCPDDPQLASERRKPELPLQPDLTANFTLIRFISHPEGIYNHAYLREWATRVGRWLQSGTDVYFFVHCPVEEHSPFTARDFYRLLIEKKVKLAPLPWDRLQTPPEQLSLF